MYGERERRDGTEEAADVRFLFREVNERIRTLDDGFDATVPRGEWVCECADSACVEQIEMSLSAYEEIRARPNLFPAIPGHERVGERVVERRPRYVVVEAAPAAIAPPTAYELEFAGQAADRPLTRAVRP